MPLSLTEDPRLPKASKGSQGFLRLQEGPGTQGGSGGKREWGGARGSEGIGGARPLSLTEDPRLPKASEYSQGFLRPQEGPRGLGRLRGWGEQKGVREVGGNGDQGVFLGTPLPVGASFGVPTTSVWPRLAPLAPNLLPSLPMDQVEIAGNGHQMVCFVVLTTCGANFLGAQHFSWTKCPSPHYQLAPLTPNGPTEVGDNGDQGVCFGPHYLWGQVLGCQQPLLGQGLLPLLPTHSPHSQWTKQR